jgi:hypothetical protein
MTKERNLLLVSLFLVFGLLAMAPCAMAQVGFNMTVGTNLYGRPEGLTEATGVVTLTGTGAGTVSSGSFFTVTYTANIANVSGTSSNTILLDCTGVLAATPPGPGPCVSSVGAPTVTNSGANGIVKIPIVSPAVVFTAAGSSTLSLYVRVNANKHGPGNVFASVTATFYSGSNASMGTQSSNPVLIINPEPTLTLGFGAFYSIYSEEADVAICLGVIKHNTEYENHVVVNVGEEFPYVLTTGDFEYTLDSGSDSVTNDTYISVTLNNIPKGFGIRAEDPIPCKATSSNSFYCAGGSLDVVAPSPDTFTGDGVTTSVVFEYDVTYQDAGFVESVNLPFKFWSWGPLGTGGLPDIIVTVAKDPNPTNDSGWSCWPTCIPRFAYKTEGLPQPAGTALHVIQFNNCLTNLLWPFVAVQPAYGWDSAIAVSNTTMDPVATYAAASDNALLAKGAAVPQNGSCAYSFYSGGNLVTQWTDATPIVAGATQGYDMSSVPNLPKGFNGNGYVYAICAFSNAKGYAFIVSNPGASNALFGNYLAEIIPDPEWNHRDTNGDGIGEGAVTPLNINRKLLKMLFYGLP